MVNIQEIYSLLKYKYSSTLHFVSSLNIKLILIFVFIFIWIVFHLKMRRTKIFPEYSISKGSKGRVNLERSKN